MAIQNKSGGTKPEMLGRPAFMSDRNAGARDTVYRAPAPKAAPKKASGGGGSSHKKSGGGTQKLPQHAPAPTPNPMLANMQTPTSAPGFAMEGMQTPTGAPGFAAPPSAFPARPEVPGGAFSLPNMQTPTSAPQGMVPPVVAGMPDQPPVPQNNRAPVMQTPSSAPGMSRDELAMALKQKLPQLQTPALPGEQWLNDWGKQHLPNWMTGTWPSPFGG